MLTLRRRSPLFLDFKQWSIRMGTSRDSMTFDTRRTREFLFVDQDHAL